MLPKIATTILHSSSRAASAVQNQSHAIKNIIQLQSNSGPNSSRGGNGPSSGGYRYHAGSRSYYGSGRAVSQAGLYESSDVSVFQTDDNDEGSSSKPLPLVRRANSTVSLAERLERRRRGPLGVLSAVKIHARSRHAFAAIIESPVRTPSRRNSMSMVDPPLADSIPLDALPPLPPSPPPPNVSSKPPSRPSTPRPTSFSLENASYYFVKLVKARSRGAAAAAAVVMDFRNNVKTPTVQEFNAALEAIQKTRTPGEPLSLLLETYNDMINRGLIPNLRTYVALIIALTDRDNEVQWAISSLQQRLKWHQLGVTVIEQNMAQQREQLRLFKEEDNLSSAISLFRALAAKKTNDRSTVPTMVFRNLLKSCAKHANEPGMVDIAIQVWSYMERINPTHVPTACFQWMIHLYGNIGDLAGAQEVFAEFRSAGEAGRLIHLADENLFTKVQTSVWTEMINTAFKCGEPYTGVSILDDMMAAGANAVPDEQHEIKTDLYAFPINSTSIPSPSADTFATVINGFLKLGDIESGWKWFTKLLELPLGPANVDPLVPTLSPTRPSNKTWRAMVEALAQGGEIDKLNELYTSFQRFAQVDNLELRGTDKDIIFVANYAHLQKLGEEHETLLPEHVRPYWDTLMKLDRQTDEMFANFRLPLATWAVKHGMVMEGVCLCDKVLRQNVSNLGSLRNAQMRTELVNITTEVYTRYRGETPLRAILLLSRLAELARYSYPVDFTTYMLHAYSKAPPQPLEVGDWIMLLNAALCLEVMPSSIPVSFCPDYSFKGIYSLLQDLAKQTGTEHRPLDVVISYSPKTLASALTIITAKEGEEAIRAWLQAVGHPTLLDDLSTSPRTSEISSDVESSTRSDGGYETPVTSPTMSTADSEQWSWLTPRETSEFISLTNWRSNSQMAYKYFLACIEKKRLPSYDVAARLVKLLERSRQMKEAENVFEHMHQKKHQQWTPEALNAWLVFLDSMLVCSAHCGHLERAHEFRHMILEAGSAPSADAYGALIFHITETTDDASNALALYHESRLRGVPGSPYLYNNIISKVAKARKADLALELFTRMKSEGILTSSITYGALIGACVRVGDAVSAENLFLEMTQQPNFQARVPPYNTMIQLYTTTKPNKERALYFYEQLQASGAQPTSYTYKLLIDAYMLEPLDVEKAEQTFQEITRREKGNVAVALEGQHVAAMINAYGCVRKDLDRAMQFFEDAKRYLPGGYDAVVFEAMFNVIMVHKRPDLIDRYLQKMDVAHVRMTAYVVNVVIRAFAVAGNITQARAIFESLSDPPQGRAALYNHAPHGGEAELSVKSDAPVYREPSTWEAMVRAELGQGNRDRALALLERLKERQYPEAVFNRISGIMVDHSVLPST